MRFYLLLQSDSILIHHMLLNAFHLTLYPLDGVRVTLSKLAAKTAPTFSATVAIHVVAIWLCYARQPSSCCCSVASVAGFDFGTVQK